MATKSFLNLTTSSNARTNWITIAISVVLAVLAFFNIIPDLEEAQSLGSEISQLIGYVKTGAWGLVFTAGWNLYNTISHLFKKD